MEGDAIASTVCAFGAIERQSTGTAFEIQTQYIRTGSTCQLRQYEKCCSFLFVLGHFRIIHKRHAKLLCGCALRQQLRHDHQPLVAGIGIVILPAAGGKGQDGIFLGEGHTVKIQPVFPRNRLKEAGQIISRGIRRNIVKANIRDEQRSFPEAALFVGL